MEAQEEKKIVHLKPEISFDDLLKVDIRICEVTSIEKVAGKDKLYKLEINTGSDTRVVVSGIAHIFEPEQVLNKKFPFVLNLAPRKIAGIESHGMIIMSEGHDDALYAIGDENANIGSVVF